MRIIEDLQGIAASILSLKLKAKVWVTAVFGGLTIGAISGFVMNWIYDPAISYAALIGLIIADHVTGMYLAYINNRFETRKATRIFWTLTAHTALLMFAFNIAKGASVLFWLDEAIFIPLCLVNMLSLIKNLSLLGLIKKEFSRWFYKKIDVYKNQYAEYTPMDRDENYGGGYYNPYNQYSNRPYNQYQDENEYREGNQPNTDPRAMDDN